MTRATNKKTILKSIVLLIFVLVVRIDSPVGGTTNHASFTISGYQFRPDIANPVSATRTAAPITISRATIERHASIISPISTAVKEKP